MNAVLSRSSTLLLVVVFVSACGKSQSPVLDSLGITSCANVKDPDKPFVVEWDDVALNEIVNNAQNKQSLIIVNYNNCNQLEPLLNCEAAGSYSEKKNVFFSNINSHELRGEGDVKVKLPLTLAKLQGSFRAGFGIIFKYLNLEPIPVGRLRAM